jgi:hypothetical protein
MAQTSPSNSGSPASRKLRIPPEDTVWKHYSPHYELPLSMTTSAAVHAILFVLIITGVFAFLAVVWATNKQPPPFTGMIDAGGGGNPDGDGHSRGDRDPLAGPERKEAAPDRERPEERSDQPKVDVKFEPVAVAREKFPELKDDPSADEVFASPTEALKRLEKVGSKARKKLMEGLQPGKGKGGSGRDGGKDKGVGRGEGPGVGPGKGGIVNERVKRALRWTMLFNTRDGRDYRKQLADLSANMPEKTIIAVPQPDGQYLVFRDLAQEPPVGRIEDIAEIKRIFWVDEKPESVQSLASAMGIHRPPPYMVVFFPEDLERKLLRLELNYGGRTEEQIQETRFQIVNRGGLYEPVVVGQR